MDKIKGGLMALGLKCGGTLQQRAERLFSTKGKTKKQIDKSLFVKKKKNTKVRFAFAFHLEAFFFVHHTQSEESNGSTTDPNQSLALLEAKVYRLAELLTTVRTATKENVERKQVNLFLLVTSFSQSGSPSRRDLQMMLKKTMIL